MHTFASRSPAIAAVFCLLLANCETGDAQPLTTVGPTANPPTVGSGGASSNPCPAGEPAAFGDAAALAQRSLGTSYAGLFPIGAAVAPSHLTRVRTILEREFNHLTAENAMKFASIQPAEGSFTFSEADSIANFARLTGKPMTGHTLIWHRQSPSWLWNDLTPEDPASIETLKQRMRAHIEAMLERYGDIVDNWDVVNEAISDTNGKTFRDAEEGSDWYRIFGNEDYVYWSFKFAYDALEARSPGSASGKLYYNDYNETLKVDRIIQMLDDVRRRGVPVDGVGLQGHYRIGWPSIADLRTTLEKFVAAGYVVKISELDVSVYNDYPSGGFQPADETACTATTAALQAEYYAALFELFREYAEHITSVTFWGVSDDQTWLDSEPVAGRNDYPLLWNDDHEPKASYFAVLP